MISMMHVFCVNFWWEKCLEVFSFQPAWQFILSEYLEIFYFCSCKNMRSWRSLVYMDLKLWYGRLKLKIVDSGYPCPWEARGFKSRKSPTIAKARPMSAVDLRAFLASCSGKHPAYDSAECHDRSTIELRAFASATHSGTHITGVRT